MDALVGDEDIRFLQVHREETDILAAVMQRKFCASTSATVGSGGQERSISSIGFMIRLWIILPCLTIRGSRQLSQLRCSLNNLPVSDIAFSNDEYGFIKEKYQDANKNLFGVDFVNAELGKNRSNKRCCWL
ncbi:hypothetical protein ACVR0S_02315 [Streptococcus dentapri]|uniref:Uncharacterized protein n=1 Tax=Streptococcus dentapri TaxID=573564 RepID=A0ABV8CZN3_9STRE